MKTNLLFGLFMAISIGLVVGCPKTPEAPPAPEPEPEPKPVSWQSKIAGEYPGTISEGGSEFDGTTWFKADGDKVSGTFKVDVGGMEYTGVLKDFTVVGDRKFKCTWVNDEDRQGKISGTFSADLSGFSGNWVGVDDDGEGDWNGKKAPPKPEPAAKAAGWQSKIAGEYVGTISEGGGESPSKTVFKVAADKISGTYEVDVSGMLYTGVLHKFTIVGDRKFKCSWRDHEDREGTLSGTFAADMSSFEGEWDSDSGGGDWNGKKGK